MGCNCNSAIEIAQLQDQYNNLVADLTPFVSGHPIVMLTDANDIAAFDSNGDGTGPWVKYAFCDGQTHSGYTTVDLRDKFVVGSGLSYSIGATGGANTITLDTTQIPAHTHTLTDPGHTHTLTDPGHTHAVTDGGHTHAASQVGHSHNGTTSTDGQHTHTPASDPGNGFVTSDNQGLFLDGVSGASEVSDSDSIAPNGDHSHTVTTDTQTPAVNITSAATGISIDSAFTGATAASNTTGITMGMTGGGLSHENRPPYFSVAFAQKIS